MDNSLLLCIFLFCLLLLVNAKEFGAELDECKETRCKHHGPTIRFPFWLKDHHPEDCRYPGFELSCTEDKDTMLELPPSVKLFVKQINYTAQQIDVSDPVGCLPRQIEILNLTASPFQFTALHDQYSVTLFNCSSDKYEYTNFDLIPCLSSHGFYIFAMGSDDEAFNAPRSCPRMNESELYRFYYINDLSLNWSKPMCRNCEVDGKKCIREIP